MKLVVDTNIIISALIKAGATRKIIFDRTFELITPSFTMSEFHSSLTSGLNRSWNSEHAQELHEVWQIHAAYQRQVVLDISEINKYREEICKKTEISIKEFYILFERLFRHIEITNSIFYNGYIEEAKELIKDISDVPFLSCALCYSCPIWSDDKHFKQQNKIKVLTTKDIINFID